VTPTVADQTRETGGQFSDERIGHGVDMHNLVREGVVLLGRGAARLFVHLAEGRGIEGRSLALEHHGVEEHVPVVVVREWLQQHDDLPQHNAECVHVDALVELFALHHFGGHPQCSTARTELILEVLARHRGLDFAEAKVNHLGAQILVEGDEQVGGLKVAVYNLGDAVQPVHAQRRVFGQLHALKQRQGASFLGLEEVFQVHIHHLRHNLDVACLRARSHEQHHVGMEDLAHDLHFFSEIIHLLGGEVLINGYFHRYFLSTTPTCGCVSVNSTSQEGGCCVRFDGTENIDRAADIRTSKHFTEGTLAQEIFLLVIFNFAGINFGRSSFLFITTIN
jgi:hypothetical protein